MSWRRFFRRKQSDADLTQEIDLHLAEEIDEFVARGMSPPEARRQALLKFGNPQRVRENLWRQNTVTVIEHLCRDLKYAARSLARAPGFTLVAVAVMALCLGATTSLFTIVRAVLLKPLPFKDPSKLVMIYEHFQDGNAGADYNKVSAADYYDWRAQTHGFEEMAAWRHWMFNLTGERTELPEVVQAAAGTWNLFSVLGVAPALGRTFSEAEDPPRANRVAILTWSLFQRRFGGDTSVIGKQVRLDANPYTVIGVLPPWFVYPDASVQVWVPYSSTTTPESLARHDFHQSFVIARLRPQVGLHSALSQVSAIQYRLHVQYLNQSVAAEVKSRPMIDDMVRDVKRPLLVLLGAVGCMLLIGCLNIANLLVARGAARQKEVAIRGALGASH